MKAKVILNIILILTILILVSCQRSTDTSQDDLLSSQLLINQSNMKLTSPVFENNQNIPSKYSCDGEDVNPALQITEVPEATQSLVLIVDDPDAPAGDWVHWLMWNINPQLQEITENSIPQGAVQGTTDFGRTGWGGPCPPSGTHRYQFKLYALDTQLDLEPSAKKKDLEQAMQSHVLDQVVLVGLYQKN